MVDQDVELVAPLPLGQFTVERLEELTDSPYRADIALEGKGLTACSFNLTYRGGCGVGILLVVRHDQGPVLRSILDDLKPEAAYFLASNGKRTAYLFLDMHDAAQIPALAEPWLLAMRANIEIVPVMTFDDFTKAAPAIEQAVKKYGG